MEKDYRGLQLLGLCSRGLGSRLKVSYRGVKRVLGETNLERKCRWLFGMCLAVLIAGSFWWYGARTEQLVYDNTRVAASRAGRACLAQGSQQDIRGAGFQKAR